MSDLSDRLSKLSPEKLELLRKKLEKDGQKSPPKKRISKRANQSEFPMSSSQQRLWFLNQLEPDSPFYNIPSAIRLKGELSHSLLEKSINDVINRHEILRAYFSTDENGEPVQLIHEATNITLDLEDISDSSGDKQNQQINRLLKKEAALAFDIHQFPLFKLRLLRLDKTDHILFVNFHHIIADGWSIGIFINEVTMLYRNKLDKKQNSLPELSIQYADYAQWQLKRTEESIVNKQLDYWRDYLAEMPELLELQTDHSRPSVMSSHGKQKTFKLNESTTAGLRSLSKQYGISLYSVLMAAFQLFLHKISGQDDFGVGAPIANRNRVEIESLIGFFVNTIVLRSDFKENISFSDLMKRVSHEIVQASDNQDIYRKFHSKIKNLGI